MKPKQIKKQRVKKTNAELFLVLFFVAVGAFVIILTLVTALSATDRPSKAEQSTVDDPPQPPNRINTVFAGGTPVRLPYTTENTADASDTINSSYAILIDAASGEILASKNKDSRFNPASMTKVMTLIVACEHLTDADLERKLKLTQEVHDYMTTGAYAGSSTSFIKQSVYLNDFVSVKDALYAIGVASAADATYLICVDVAGSEEAFVALMNQKAAALGLQNTHFDNAIGHESENNYTTASDMAALMAYAIQCDRICNILSQKTTYSCNVYCDADGTLYEGNYHWYLNSSLFNTASEASSRFKAYSSYYGTEFSLKSATFCGGKTGTLGDGTKNNPWVYSLVSYATQGGKTYIAVTGEVLTGAFVMKDAKTLYDDYIK